MTDFANVPAVAQLIREKFPELGNRAFAVMEAGLTKENMPNLPLSFTALLHLSQINGSNDVATPQDMLETICVEFWLEPKKYQLASGGESPFYAYQDYYTYLNRLFAALDGFFTPVGKIVRFLSMSTTSDDFAFYISFKLSIKWRWCPDVVDSDDPVVRMHFSIDPRVPQLPHGTDYLPPDPCGQLPHITPINPGERP